MANSPFKYGKAQKSHLIRVISKLAEELNCDIEEITAVIYDNEVKNSIIRMVHFNKYNCSPEFCKACKRKIPHDSHIFDSESIVI